MYKPLAPGSDLVQGAIIDDCPLFLLNDPAEIGARAIEPELVRARVVVLTQACDIAQDKTVNVLVAQVNEAKILVENGILPPGKVRDNIRRHAVFGWYFLPAAMHPLEFPESIVDLHELHTVHRAILDRLIAEGKGVCRLDTPYREHLAQHFGVTYMRIGLPEPYETQP